MRNIFTKSAVAALMVGAGLALALPAQRADAQNIFEFLFGGMKQQPQQRQPAPTPSSQNPIENFFNDAFGNREQAPSRSASSGLRGGSAGFCVRTCDGKYFPLLKSATTPEQMCQAFCPATTTKVYFGSAIDDATSASGERYGDSNTAFAFRKAMKADCTCNGRSPAGLAQVDLSLDSSLRPGDVVATDSGLVAYTGRGGAQDFTPVAGYPGLTSEVRSRLGEMKVSPNPGDQTSLAPADAPAAQAVTTVQRTSSTKNGRALLNAEASAR